MLGKHKSRLLRLSTKLQELSNSPTNLDLLIELQLEILNSIKATEKHITILRQRKTENKHILRTSRLPRQEANTTKAVISALDIRIKHYQKLLNIWRSYGDGIAFIYLDKWAVKPLLYNTNNPDIKNSAGSILGKSGLKNELQILREILRRGVPALLTDLTNCIRHGDICLLHCSDPILIEVKSSNNTNARINRQIENIESIHNYHATDEATNIRGMPLIKREELSTPEEHYRHLFDEGIAVALTEGFFKADPEPGFRFLAITSNSKRMLDTAFEEFQPSEFFILNDFKNEGGWGVYFPYTLSIKSAESLYAFLDGQVSLFVIFDHDVIKSIAKQKKLIFSLTTDNTWPYQFNLSESAEPATKISSHFVARMACELLSWNWILEEERGRLTKLKNSIIL